MHLSALGDVGVLWTPLLTVGCFGGYLSLEQSRRSVYCGEDLLNHDLSTYPMEVETVLGASECSGRCWIG